VSTDKPKAQLVRDHMLSLRDGDKFTTNSIANSLKIKLKDVNNVVLRLSKAGAVTRKRGNDRRYVYTINANVIAAYFAKYPTDYHGTPPPIRITPTKTESNMTRRKNRPTLVVAIDVEIAELEAKIKRLQSIRKEYM